MGYYHSNNDIAFKIQDLNFLIARPLGISANEKFTFGLRNIDDRDLILIDVGMNVNTILLAVDWATRGGEPTEVFMNHLAELGIKAHTMEQQFTNPRLGVFYGTRRVISIIDPESVVLFKLAF